MAETVTGIKLRSNRRKASFISFFLLFLLLAALSVSADENKTAKRNYQRIIPLSSPMYEEIDRLYLINGMALPSTSRPWSVDEAMLVLDRLPVQLPSPAEELSYKVINRELSEDIDGGEKGKACWRISGELNIEGYIKGNDSREEWEHGFEEREPLLSVPVEGWFGEGFYTTMDLTLKEEYRAVTEIENNYTSIPSNLRDFDWYFPFRSYLSWGGENWNLQFGRDQADWGMGETGNLLLSDYSEFYNMVRFTSYWDNFKMSFIYIGLDAWLTSGEEDYGDDLAGDYDNYREQFKAFLAHRTEFRTTEKLNINFSEAIVFGNKYLNITELNPVFVFHNLFSPEYSNAMISIEADYTAAKGLNLYLQFAVDEFQVPGYEGADTRPGANGYLAGIKYIKPAGTGYITLISEFALTDPYLYNRWHPLTRFTNRRRMWSNIDPDGYEYVNKPIGYEHGPDALVLYSKIEYVHKEIYKASLDARYKLTGELNDSLDDYLSYDTGTDANSRYTVTGTAEKELVTGLHAVLFPEKRLSWGADFYWINISNYKHDSGRTLNDLELALSGKLRF